MFNIRHQLAFLQPLVNQLVEVILPPAVRVPTQLAPVSLQEGAFLLAPDLAARAWKVWAKEVPEVYPW